MERIEIDKNKPLNPGDIIEMHFKSIGLAWLQAAQIALIEYKLKGEPTFEILSTEIRDKTTAIFKIRVKKTNPVVVTAAIIGGIIIGVGIMAWLTLDKVYQIMETPAGKVTVAGWSMVPIVGGGILLWFLLKK